jgi:hypothetical protein
MKSFGRGHGTLEIDVLTLRSAQSLAQTVEQLRTAGSKVTEQYRDARRCGIDRGEDSSLEGWPCRVHDACRVIR